MVYTYPGSRWPKGRGPFEVRRPREQALRPFVLRSPVVGRSGVRYVVSSQPPRSDGWALFVVVPDALDLWVSYIHDRRSGTRLVQEFYSGPRASGADRSRVFADFGLRSTLVQSNV